MPRLNSSETLSWQTTFQAIRRKEILILFFLGLSAGLPILLIFSSLSLWLREAGMSRSLVTFFSWAALGYSFKFAWAPLVDRVALPVLSPLLGQRRSWLLLAQIAVILSIAGMAMTDPSLGSTALTMMALFAVLLGFSSATQDIVIDAYRIEVAEDRMQALLASSYIAGYRVGMIAAGAGALYLADFWGSTLDAYRYDAWKYTYLSMSALMLIGVTTTFLMPEPQVDRAPPIDSTRDKARLLLMFLICVLAFVFVFSSVSELSAGVAAIIEGPVGALLGQTLRFALSLLTAIAAGYCCIRFQVVQSEVAQSTWISPVRSFFDEHGLKTAVLILALIGLYRISDIVLGVVSNVFYQDMGYSKTEIANAVKTFGVIISIAGSFAGGFLANRYGVVRCLMWGGILAAGTNLMFILLAVSDKSMLGLYLVVATDNLAAGFASAAFIAFLSSLTNINFTAVQYAIFSSLMTLFPKTLGGYSGSMVDALGYPSFFMLTALMGLPVLYLIYRVSQRFRIEEPKISRENS